MGADVDANANATDASAEGSKASESVPEKKEKKKEKKKKTKTIKVKKEQKKVHKESFAIEAYHTSKCAPYSKESMQESVDKLATLAAQDLERKRLEGARNRLEASVYSIKNFISDNEEDLDKVSTVEQREALVTLASETEDWLYDDGYNAELKVLEDKHKELNTPSDAMKFRLEEATKRPAAVAKLKEMLEKMRALMVKWETTHDHITEEERGGVYEKISEVEKWLEKKFEEQGKLDKSADPAFLSADLPKNETKEEPGADANATKVDDSSSANETESPGDDGKAGETETNDENKGDSGDEGKAPEGTGGEKEDASNKEGDKEETKGGEL